jgi:hypothetical protein
MPSPAPHARCTLDQPGALERVDEALSQSQKKGRAQSPLGCRGLRSAPIAIKGRSNSAHEWERPLPALIYGGQPLERWPSGGQTAASVVSSYRPGVLMSDAGSYRMGPPGMRMDGLLPGDTSPDPGYRRGSLDGQRRPSYGQGRSSSGHLSQAPSLDWHSRTLRWAYATQAVARPHEQATHSPPPYWDLSDPFVPSSRAASPVDLGVPAPGECELWESRAQPGGYGAVNGGQEVFFDFSEDGSEPDYSPSAQTQRNTPLKQR